MRRLVQCAGVLAALALGAAPAHAVVTTWDFSGCGGNSFSTCFSVSAYEDNGVFVLALTNDGAAEPGTFESVFTAIGFAELPFDVTGFAQAPTGDGSWDFSDNINDLNGVIQAGAFAGGECDAVPGGPPNGCKPTDDGLNPGETVTFYFNFDGTFDLTGGILGIHGQVGPNGCSTKVFTTVNGSPNQPSNPNECGTPDTTIPEPITMTLLGTGLAGMGGANLLRRRRKNEDEVV